VGGKKVSPLGAIIVTKCSVICIEFQ